MPAVPEGPRGVDIFLWARYPCRLEGHLGPVLRVIPKKKWKGGGHLKFVAVGSKEALPPQQALERGFSSQEWVGSAVTGVLRS